MNGIFSGQFSIERRNNNLLRLTIAFAFGFVGSLTCKGCGESVVRGEGMCLEHKVELQVLVLILIASRSRIRILFVLLPHILLSLCSREGC